MMNTTQDNILIQPIELKKTTELLSTGLEYISAKVLSVGCNIKEIEKGDIIIFEKNDIQKLEFNSHEYKYIHVSKVILYEKRKTKKEEKTKK